MTLRTGDKLDRYTIEALLGEGGMGQVYRAADDKLHRRVALKVLRVGDASDESSASEGKARLLREARAAAALDHPNAIAIFDVGEVNGDPYIAMELVEGKSLRSYVGDVTVPIERRLRWLADIARALGAAHKRGLVHRDVKPENVMVRDDGAIKVLDFGIARRTSAAVDPNAPTSAESLATITERGVAVGTPLYMAPEQMRGESLDGRADEFAWGVVAYELLTGRCPWVGRDSLQIVSQILSADPTAPIDVSAQVPRAVSDLVMKALSKRATGRFEKMEALVEELDRMIATPSSRDAAVVTAEHTAPPGRRTLRAAAVLAVGVAALATYLWMQKSPAPTPIVASATATAPASARPTAVTDLPLPPSSNPEAIAAYRAAMQAYRDASGPRVHLQRAVDLDPSLAAAHLRLATLHGTAETGAARDSYRRAVGLRASLTERDVALLDALQPFLGRDPADLAEWERRMTEIVSRWPLDADLLMQLVLTYWVRGKFRDTEPLLDRVLAIDAGNANAHHARAAAKMYAGEYDAAKTEFDECLRISPAAVSCMSRRVALLTTLGECAGVEADARRMIMAYPEWAYGYDVLARALAARGRPQPLVLETFRQAWARAPAGRRKTIELADSLNLALLAGDFDGAAQIAADLERATAAVADEMTHADLSRARAELAIETGRPAEAARVAADFLGRRDAWSRGVFVEDYSFARDAVPRLLAAQLRAGSLTKPAFDAKRAEWLAGWEAKLEGDYRGLFWLHAYADVVETREEALDALAAMPRFPPLSRFRPETLADAQVGRVQLLAGNAPEAARLLALGVANCRVLDEPIEHTRAHWFLGQAREAIGDRAGACAAYRVVLDRWSAAKRSVTAEKTRARVRALACGG